MNTIISKLPVIKTLSNYKTQVIPDNESEQLQNDSALLSNSLESLDAYNRYILTRNIAGDVSFVPMYSKTLSLHSIPNYSRTLNQGIRGESLSSKKNRKFLKLLKENGVNKIIDLREKYASQAFPDLCEQYGLEYFNIPVDASSVTDRSIIDNLPTLFDVINDGHYYIACAQGLHRTDIALSIDYVFNPKAKEPPVLIGHFRNGKLKTEDISRRLHSIKKELTDEDLKKLGWDDSFEDEFKSRKEFLYDYNNKFFKNSEK